MARITSEEQDIAAGGASNRRVVLADGAVVTASVAIQLFKRSHQHWAYLRFKNEGKTVRRYIGNVTSDSREQSLTLGWALVRQKSIVEESGWTWAESPRT